MKILFLLSYCLIVHVCVCEVNNYRLINTCEPLHYDVFITPYLESAPFGKVPFTFDGTIDITFRTLDTPTNKIQFHTKSLIIDYDMVKILVASRQIEFQTPEYNNVTDILTINLLESIKPSIQFRIMMYYSGLITDSMFGFYYSTYENENGEIEYLAITQLQQTETRKLLPCNDEPSSKSTFRLTIAAPAGYSVVSNTKTETDNKLFVLFKVTPIMPAYLLAFMVSKFEAKSNDENTFSVWSRPELTRYTTYSLDRGVEILKKLEEYLDYKFYGTEQDVGMNFEHMNMVAVPDIIPGGMENWGMITFKESGLIYHENFTSAMAQQKIVAVIAHEVAHAWFGNLVTCEWWDYTWLNEAFARYLQYFIPHMLYNDWEMDKQFIIEQLQPSMLYDTSYKTHPLTYAVETQDEANEIFDFISYNKGSTIVRMISYVLGDIKFRELLQVYLKTNAFKSVVPQNFYDAYDSITFSAITASEFLEPWVSQAGYPIITVNITEDRSSAIITQNKFYYTKPEKEDSTLWPVHLIYEIGNQATRNSNRQLLTEKTATINFSGGQLFVLFNLYQHGYYRVDYDLTTWKNLNNSLHSTNHDEIYETNRAQIVDDLFNLARADYHSYDFIFNILSYLKSETGYLPWYSAFVNFHYLSQRANGENLRKIRSFINALLKENFDRVGFNEQNTETRLETYHRNNVLYWYCKTGAMSCVTTAQNLFANYRDNDQLVPVNIRPAVYCTVIRYSDESYFDYLWSKFLATNIATEKVVILNALGCTASAQTLAKYLDYIFDGSSKIRKQDRFIAFSSTYLSYEENVTPVLNYIIEQYPKIQTAYGSINQVAVLLIELIERFSSQDQINAAVSFIDKHKTDFAGMIEKLDIVLQIARDNLKWSDKHIPEIINFFDDYTAVGDDSDGGSVTIQFYGFGLLITCWFFVKLIFVI